MIIIHVTFIAVIIILVIIISSSSISFIMNTIDIKYLLFPKVARKS